MERSVVSHIYRYLACVALVGVSSACGGAAVAPGTSAAGTPAPSPVLTAITTSTPSPSPASATPSPQSTPFEAAVGTAPAQPLPTVTAMAVTTAPPSGAVPPRAPTAGGTGTVVDRLIEMAKSDLAGREAVAVSEITVVSSTPQEWRDSSLGCPRPGGIYAQVITPGYLIVLEVRGSQYEYHTDSTSRVVLCGNP